MNRPYPIIEFAQKIGKNTADLTTKDLCAFMVWWVQQKPREDLINMASNYKQDLAAMQKFREEEAEKTVKGEFAADSVVEGEEVVCSMELTKVDVTALLFAIHRVFEDYDMNGHEYGDSLTSLKEGLEGV